MSVVVPQAIGISLRNRIGDSARDVPCFYLGLSIGTMGLIFLIFSLFLPVYVSHFIVCLSIDTPLYWFGLALVFTTAFSVYADFWPKVAYIRGFLAKKSRTYATVLYAVAYILPFGEFYVVGSCWVGCECGWVFLWSDVVCWMLLL